ncbi:MAG: hypothetical protein AB7O59_12860 [Pirellulales bacterium]
MTIDRHTLEQIDACRPGSVDLQSAELADLQRQVAEDPQVQSVYARTQKWDAAVVAATQRVAVPDGLADRILQALARSATVLPASAGQPAAGGLATAIATAASAGTFASSESQLVAPEPKPEPATRKARFSRRDWLAIGAAVAATVVVATFVSQFVAFGEEATIESMADEWLAELEPKWLNMQTAPRGFAVPGAITAEATGWQRIGQIGQVRGIAYKLAHATAGTARLFVVRLSKGGVPGAPPAAPQSTTGGKSVGYWQAGGLVYVLVVDGNVRNYRAFVSSAGMPLA